MANTVLQLDKENKQLIVRYGLHICKNCGQLMIPLFGDAHYLPRNIQDNIRVMGIKSETYSEMGMCNDCLKSAGYPKNCDECGNTCSFPNEFSFELSFWPQYPEEDTTYHYICSQCHSMRAQQVIDKLLRADEIKDLRKGL